VGVAVGGAKVEVAKRRGVNFSSLSRLRTVLNTNVKLDGVRVPVENRLANSRGFGDAVRVLTPTRHNVAWEAVGHAVAAYEAALTYAKERVQFGKPIASFQLIQSKLARMLADITGMQTLCFRLSQLSAEGRMTIAMASLAKMHNAQSAYRVVADARDILGGNGVLLEYHVARHLADMQAVYTYDGTDTILSLVVGREITGHPAFS
jgi:glutaryl-CoA dehydrogenase